MQRAWHGKLCEDPRASDTRRHGTGGPGGPPTSVTRLAPLTPASTDVTRGQRGGSPGHRPLTSAWPIAAAPGLKSAEAVTRTAAIGPRQDGTAWRREITAPPPLRGRAHHATPAQPDLRLRRETRGTTARDPRRSAMGRETPPARPGGSLPPLGVGLRTCTSLRAIAPRHRARRLHCLGKGQPASPSESARGRAHMVCAGRRRPAKRETWLWRPTPPAM